MMLAAVCSMSTQERPRAIVICSRLGKRTQQFASKPPKTGNSGDLQRADDVINMGVRLPHAFSCCSINHVSRHTFSSGEHWRSAEQNRTSAPVGSATGREVGVLRCW